MPEFRQSDCTIIAKNGFAGVIRWMSWRKSHIGSVGRAARSLQMKETQTLPGAAPVSTIESKDTRSREVLTRTETLSTLVLVGVG